MRHYPLASSFVAKEEVVEIVIRTERTLSISDNLLRELPEELKSHKSYPSFKRGVEWLATSLEEDCDEYMKLGRAYSILEQLRKYNSSKFPIGVLLKDIDAYISTQQFRPFYASHKPLTMEQFALKPSRSRTCSGSPRKRRSTSRSQSPRKRRKSPSKKRGRSVDASSTHTLCTDQDDELASVITGYVPSDASRYLIWEYCVDLCVVCGENSRSNADADWCMLPCGDVFHRKCAQRALSEKQSVCPSCEFFFPSQPSGQMRIRRREIFSSEGNIFCFHLSFLFPEQRQEPHCPFPGKSILHTTREAYLPTSPPFVKILEAIKKLFKERRLFVIGRSQERQVDNVVCWGPIPLKSELSDQEFGLSRDPERQEEYLTEVMEALRKIGVTVT